jgi:hypothetical protein
MASEDAERSGGAEGKRDMRMEMGRGNNKVLSVESADALSGRRVTLEWPSEAKGDGSPQCFTGKLKRSSRVARSKHPSSLRVMYDDGDKDDGVFSADARFFVTSQEQHPVVSIDSLGPSDVLRKILCRPSSAPHTQMKQQAHHTASGGIAHALAKKNADATNDSQRHTDGSTKHDGRMKAADAASGEEERGVDRPQQSECQTNGSAPEAALTGAEQKPAAHAQTEAQRKSVGSIPNSSTQKALHAARDQRKPDAGTQRRNDDGTTIESIEETAHAAGKGQKPAADVKQQSRRQTGGGTANALAGRCALASNGEHMLAPAETQEAQRQTTGSSGLASTYVGTAERKAEGDMQQRQAKGSVETVPKVAIGKRKAATQAQQQHQQRNDGRDQDATVPKDAEIVSEKPESDAQKHLKCQSSVKAAPALATNAASVDSSEHKYTAHVQQQPQTHANKEEAAEHAAAATGKSSAPPLQVRASGETAEPSAKRQHYAQGTSASTSAVTTSKTSVHNVSGKQGPSALSSRKKGSAGFNEPAAELQQCLQKFPNELTADQAAEHGLQLVDRGVTPFYIMKEIQRALQSQLSDQNRRIAVLSVFDKLVKLLKAEERKRSATDEAGKKMRMATQTADSWMVDMISHVAGKYKEGRTGRHCVARMLDKWSSHKPPLFKAQTLDKARQMLRERLKTDFKGLSAALRNGNTQLDEDRSEKTTGLKVDYKRDFKWTKIFVPTSQGAENINEGDEVDDDDDKCKRQILFAEDLHPPKPYPSEKPFGSETPPPPPTAPPEHSGLVEEGTRSTQEHIIR